MEYIKITEDVESLGSSLQAFRSKVHVFKKLCDKIGTPQEYLNMSEDLNSTRLKILSESKRLTYDIRQCRPSVGKEIKYKKIKSEFESTLRVFQQLNSKVLEREKKELREDEQRYTMSLKLTFEERQSLAFQSIAEINEDDLRRRQEEIQQIEKDMVIVNNMFKDVETMVVQQQDLLNSVEHYVDKTEKETGETVKELAAAENHQRKNKSKTCRICVIVAVVVSALALIVLAIVGSI